MGLLKPATNQTAFLKMGIYGFQGSGKTYTASRILAGLLKQAKVEKPTIAMFDTEKSSDFLVDYYQSQGIELLAIKSRAFKDLIDGIKEAESSGVHGFILDSATHVWRELMDAYLKKSSRDFLTMSDWGPIKDEWSQLTTKFINSKMHFITLGRAGYEWEHQENDKGRQELVKTGTKMKAEGEFGYESDILVEMERVRVEVKRKNKPDTNKYVHRAWILKDRWDLLDGKYFDDPTWKDLDPIFKKLNLGGEHFGVGDSDSQEIFGSPDWSYHEQKKLREIALEELQAVLVKADLAGTAKEAQKNRIETLEEVFGTSSKRALEEKWAPELEAGIERIKEKFGLSAPKVAEKTEAPAPAKKSEKLAEKPEQQELGGQA